MAGFYAIGLSDSGWGNLIEDAEEIRFLTIEANANVSSAASTLSGRYCNFLSCKNPKEAKMWLIKSALLSEPIGTNELAFYEKRL